MYTLPDRWLMYVNKRYDKFSKYKLSTFTRIFSSASTLLPARNRYAVDAGMFDYCLLSSLLLLSIAANYLHQQIPQWQSCATLLCYVNA